jgi:hypothetical protein
MSADPRLYRGGRDADPPRGLGGARCAALPEGLRRGANHTGELTYEVPPRSCWRRATSLRDAPDLKFEMCMDVCGVDYLEHGRAEWKTEHATNSGFSRGVARGRPRLLPRIGAGRGSAWWATAWPAAASPWSITCCRSR